MSDTPATPNTFPSPDETPDTPPPHTPPPPDVPMPEVFPHHETEVIPDPPQTE